MEKVWKRLIAISLSLMLMFTMGLNVFAAEGVEGTPNDDPVVTLDESGIIDLTITNNTGMFKALTAYLTTEDGQEYLVMALSGTGYKELFKGTYEEAVENGDGSVDHGNNTWIHSYTNEAGKLEFKIPLNADDSFVPVVAVSNSYYTKYLNGQNELSRVFYARQFTLDRNAKTIVTDDYNETTDFTVTSSVPDFKVASEATTHVVGGPNNNGYSVEPTLVMEDSSYDKVTYPTVVGNAIGTAEATLTDSKFEIKMQNAPNRIAFKDKEPIEMIFHVSEDAPYAEAGTDVVRTVTVDKAARTIIIEGEALHANKLKYDGATVQFINENGDAFGMWAPQEGSTFTYSDGQIHLSIIPKNNTIYKWMHWGRINEELTKDVELDSAGKIVLELSAEEYCGWAVPVAPIKAADDTATTKTQYYLAVPALAYFVDADYTAVDAALATVPEDLSPYTEATAAAVTEAVNAVARDKKANEQADVDAMAEAIDRAVKALRIDISKATVAKISEKTFTGKALKPGVTASFDGRTLVKGTDYDVTKYENNTNVGTAKITLTGKGNFAGTKIVTFKIKPAAQKLLMSKAQKSVKFKTLKKKAVLTSKVAVSGAKTKVTYVKKGGSKKLTINKKTGKIKVAKKTKKGTYKIKVKATAAKSKNYKAASITKTIIVKVK